MITLHEGAYAKLNLTMEVLGKRPDGYHDIRSVMQAISLRDDIRLELDTAQAWSLSCDAPGIPTDESNLAWKAAKLFFDTTGHDPNGLNIHITKRIPAQAGLGGGSADAAAVLRALNRHYDAPFSLPALAELGAQIGSDVPFCVLCGTAMAEGRGERLRPLSPMPDCVFVVCKPEFSVSTPELYRAIDDRAVPVRPNHRAMERALLAGDLGGICDSLCNVFDTVVTADHMELNYIKSIFNSYGAIGYQMTGSGSAVYAIVESFEYAAVICNMLRENYPQIYIAKPI